MSKVAGELQETAVDPSGDRKFITALARGFEILRAFQPGGGALGNQELSVATGIPKATVTRLTHTLEELGYLRHLKPEGKYEPTEAILALGYSVISNLVVRQVAHDPMMELALEHDVSVGLASRDRLSMIFVDVCKSRLLSTLHLDVGSRVPMPSTAVGRAFLAGVTGDERAFFFERFEERLGKEAWSDLRPRVEDAIAQVDERGYCYVEDEWHRGMRAVATPLVASNGSAVMSMMCGAPAFRVERAKLEQELGPQLAHLCAGLAPSLR
ncbi:IclR family transcriptional regulator [Jannaschia seohaensis]|uniref:DNA-binding IclR family transcriptional regulator n=1 Tax=Jannaschia seohaensis TaxID=475081 RepID=A0A2Y9C783_9RHOB|nr:IclR family transcriptional regulator [Jannaschia seohaensis]PWJ20597.1 DNA-binding IclR family transcriptional regulator [Jannaschia seohaensis]SSA44693.1 DNA-binding transcriptional regulator, IclR family [Jannaschia seohaensis]